MRTVATCSLLVALAASSARAADEPAGITVTVDAVNRYVSRGYDLSHSDADSLVYLYYAPPALPGVTLSTGFIFGLVNERTRGDRKRDIDEVDFNLGYERPLLSWLTASAALHHYTYSSQFYRKVSFADDRDTEASLSLSFAPLAGVSSSLSWYHGMDEKVRGNYFEAAVSRPFLWTERLSSTPRVAAGWSSEYGIDHEISNVTTSIPLTWTVGNLAVTPSVTYVRVRRPEIMNGNDRKNLLAAGLNLTLSF